MTMDAHETRPSSNGPRRKIMIIAVASGVAIGGFATGAWGTGGGDHRDDATFTQSVSSLDVEVASGDVEVIGSDRDDIVLAWRARSGLLSDAAVDHKITDGHLTVTGTCGSGFMSGGCLTDIVLKVPSDVEVVVEGSAGDVTVAGLVGRANVRSDAGDVRIENQSGNITAHASAGDVSADGLAADTAEFTSDAGDIFLELREAGSEIVADSSAGDVTVTVPNDGEPYAVDTQTAAGDNTVDVPTDPSAERTIEATTNAGDVTVTTP